MIPPPVDTAFFTPGADRPGAYDLVVSALAPYKRLDLVLDAYRGTGWPLRIVGTGPEEARLRALAPPEATLLGRVDDEELRDPGAPTGLGTGSTRPGRHCRTPPLDQRRATVAPSFAGAENTGSSTGARSLSTCTGSELVK